MPQLYHLKSEVSIYLFIIITGQEVFTDYAKGGKLQRGEGRDYKGGTHVQLAIYK